MAATMVNSDGFGVRDAIARKPIDSQALGVAVMQSLNDEVERIKSEAQTTWSLQESLELEH
ncbi:uncharacterized protein G2W53_000915 [Senna tora]|uniref:Uncharacterized protein n=1 Tax=Senna tora TaxID=362788 RepID=A0A834XGI6_9FABA|nr:uncharacterized protein G2W53_000915 [Senna tora]